jgi:hypothetical protein
MIDQEAIKVGAIIREKSVKFSIKKSSNPSIRTYQKSGFIDRKQQRVCISVNTG